MKLQLLCNLTIQKKEYQLNKTFLSTENLSRDLYQ